MKKIKFETVNIIESHDWDKLVKEVYNKPYSLQQQEGCQERGTTYEINVPYKNLDDEYDEADKIPFEINGDEIGVSFKAWLEADPKQHKIDNNWDDFYLGLFWNRNFYPDVAMIAQDLYEKGYIDAGSYTIKIDW